MADSASLPFPIASRLTRLAAAAGSMLAVVALGVGVSILAVLEARPLVAAAIVPIATLLGVAMRREYRYQQARDETYQAEHAVVVSLQRRLLAPVPDLAGLEIAAHYEPAAGAIGMGGDWYAVVQLDDGSTVVVVGDVIGHGVEAVAVMAQLQYLVAGLLRARTPLGEVFARTNAMIQGQNPVYATAQLLHLDLANGRLGHLNAGHPWAVMRHPDGRTEYLDGCRQPLLGVPMEPTHLQYVDIESGSSVLMYSDGLIERRYETITESIDRLARVLGPIDADRPLDEILTEVVERLRRPEERGEATSDDVVAVLIRCTDVPTNASTRPGMADNPFGYTPAMPTPVNSIDPAPIIPDPNPNPDPAPIIPPPGSGIRMLDTARPSPLSGRRRSR